MSVAYVTVQWNAHKRIYDMICIGAVIAYIVAFMAIGTAIYSAPNSIGPEILLMRALATCAFVLLHVILCIGPLSRLTPLVSPLLYNRRHLGVLMFLVALAHSILAVMYYGSFGGRNPILATLADHQTFSSISSFPFEIFGLGALLILFVMAATSHDFWLKTLSPAMWKWLHMGVYVAYALLVLHVCTGILQSERSLLYPIMLGLGVCTLTGLHFASALTQRRRDSAGLATPSDWLDVCELGEIAEGRAKIVSITGGESVAVFRIKDSYSAISNTCVHQGGPLGEGKIVNGCVTCPWHGYQYLAHCGQSPPPFTEKLPTYELRIQGSRLKLNPRALPPGTAVAPASVSELPTGVSS